MRISVLIIILLATGTCYGQSQPTPTPTPHPLGDVLGRVKQVKKDIQDQRIPETQAKERIAVQVTRNLLEWVQYLASPLAGTEAVKSFLSEAEQKRLDKQVGSGANTSGSTSLVSKGSVPSLIGLAVENGAMTQETSGTVITFRVNPASFINALVKKNYLTSGNTNVLTNKEADFYYRLLNKVSLSVSFDTSKGPSAGTFTAERSQLTGYSGHLDIINHRDPRDGKNQQYWEKLRREAGTNLANSLTQLRGELRNVAGFGDWVTNTASDLFTASSDNDVEAVLLRRAVELQTLVNNDIKFLELMKSQVIPAANRYAAERVGLLNKISKSFLLSFDYSNTRQIVTLGNTEGGMITLPAGVTNGLPDLGNFLLTASFHLPKKDKAKDIDKFGDDIEGFIYKWEFTINISGTRFNGRRVGPKIGRWRDARAAVQVDIPLPKIEEVGKPTLTFSYLHLNLLEEPLGEKIKVNGVEQSRKGPINFGQAKLEFPIRATGMSIPISMTFSNRTELIKEKDVRGHIGITFDLDKIFSKNK